MSVVNRRNAVVGYLVILVGKRYLRQTARDAVPAIDPETKRPNKSLVAVTLASAVGVMTLWRLRTNGDDADSSAE
jgi:hypothetical protein